MHKVKSRPLSFVIIFFIYAAAYAAGCVCYGFVKGTPLLRMFLADIAATAVVFIFSLVFCNASVYDPYWSVAPLLVVPSWMVVRGSGLQILDILLLTAFFIWGLRLTINWVSVFKGLAFQDWRYTMYQQNNPGLWPLINFTGIQMMPTVLVFGGMMPAYFCIQNQRPPNMLTMTGFFICIIFVCVQFISDNQLARFKKKYAASHACIQQGLWKFSRHPNYLGEIMFWWGVYIMQLSILPQDWYTIIGPSAISLLFIFISIPMMEKHVTEKREGYAEYKKRVSMLIPWPKKYIG